MLVAWVLYPLVLLALCAGLGLLVDSLTGRRLPGALIVPVGLAAIVVVGSVTTLSDFTAGLTTPLLVFGALAGAWAALPWRFGRFGRAARWPAAAALAVFLAYGAPVIASGEPTFAGYVKLDDTATWLAITDRVMEHGTSVEGLAPSTYEATLDFNLAGGYPAGAFVPFGAAAKVLGAEIAWVFQPYLAFLGAMLSLALWGILAGPIPRPAPRAGAAALAAMPALLYGYSLWGGVKEMAAAALIALAAALAPRAIGLGGRGEENAVEVSPAIGTEKSTAEAGDPANDDVGEDPDASLSPDERAQRLAPLAIAVGAVAGVLSPGGLAWLGPMLLAALWVAWRRFGREGALSRAVPFALLAAVLVVPLVFATGLLPPTSTPLTNQNDAANLGDPLSPFQLAGVWPVRDFRVSPDSAALTAALLAVALGAAAFGLWSAWRRRTTAVLLYATALIACAGIAAFASPWVDGKLLAIASPVVLTLALVGAAALHRLDRPTGIAVAVVLAGGVLASNALAYTDPYLAPHERLSELERIGEDFSGEGPALITEYNPYGARHFLRTLDAEGASELRRRQVPLVGGGTAPKGETPDTDEIDSDALITYRTLIVPRKPATSRPPSPYQRVWRGEHYEVWQRPTDPGEVAPVLHHMGIGTEDDRGGLPDCSQVVGLGLLALSNQLGFAPQDITLLAAPAGSRTATLVAYPVDRARELCGRRWDWIEAVGPAPVAAQ